MNSHNPRQYLTLRPELKADADQKERAVFNIRDLKFADGAGRKFSGYGAVFGNVDSYGDVIAKGAFARSLSEHQAAGTMPAMLSQHGPMLGGDEMMPIGVWTTMMEDDHGLLVEGRLSDTPRGNEAYTLLKDRALRGLSIGYIARKYTLRTKPEEPRRTLTDIELIEVSLVTFPANPKARVDAVKGVQGKAITPRDCEHALRDAGVPRELAKAIVAKGWRAATDQRDAEGEGFEALAAALNARADSLSTLLKRMT